ncbi:hypothetical protein B2M23_01570 [Eubacterium limosum]|uniref:Uncharacterized protein n=1 Tax=Eubacterium limosum TaxID=1736 RepID=A0AAC9W4N6_EUBLI|nr:hypothetical protein B2M23_01570 [Eubacterium limosum]
MTLLCFGAFMLELLSIFGIESALLGVDVGNYTAAQRSIHSLITAGLWAVFMAVVVGWTRRSDGFPEHVDKSARIPARDWAFALVCLAGCKVMTFMDWHTLKVIGEAQNKDAFQFLAQYIYYLLEVGLVLLIIIYGQKAVETLLKRKSGVPFGGILLALTWGAFHFVSRGAGLELWNGVSCMIFSILSGFMYLKVGRRPLYSYVLIAVGYLL